MATQRRYSIEFKRQVVQEYQGGETLHGLAKRHGISRNRVAFGLPRRRPASSTTTLRPRASCRSTRRGLARSSDWSGSWRWRTSF